MAAAANDDAPSRLEIGAEDLDAYVEGRLGPARRRAVEGFLACNPDVAAQVMTRLHMAGRPAAPPRRRRLGVIAAVIGLTACFGAGVGWAAAEHYDLDGWRELDGGPPPEYVEEAAEARQASDLRQQMASQVETPSLDADEIRTRLRIALPPLPDAWRVLDVQVFPTDGGPGVNLVLEAPGGRRLQLFAVRGPAGDERPEIAAKAGEQVIFWRRGGVAYVLSGPQAAAELRAQAVRLGAA